MNSATASNRTSPLWVTALVFIGPVLFYLGATAFGIMEVHYSTDTWIGLAAGRQILTSDDFPKTDTFSYTGYGRDWYNQNWLTHLIQYWLYAYVSPNAVIYGTWAIAAYIFFFVLLATYWRGGSWLAAFLAAGVVGLGCRDFLSARPATTGIFCIAALWALICALEGQGDKRRWWPIALILPLLLFWGCAHGSFIFGYGVLGLYVGHWYVLRVIKFRHGWVFTLPLVLMCLFIGGAIFSLVPQGAETKADEIITLGVLTYYKGKLGLVLAGLAAYAAYWIGVRFSKPTPTLSDRQVAGIVAALMAGLILTIALGPFHLKNFTHGEKIASSSVFRQVAEWNPPFARQRDGTYILKPDLTRDTFPPMTRFWWILSITVLMLILLGFHRTARALWPPPPGGWAKPRLLGLFDLAMLLIGLAMTLWARRFAPVFYIFALPLVMTWVLNRLRTLPDFIRNYGRYAVAAGASAAAIIVIVDAWSRAEKNLVEQFRSRPELNLLERVTRYDSTPHDSILFLRENRLEVNLVAEWTVSAPVMFYVPTARIFMDGRAQQVYDEEQYKKYESLLVAANTPPNVRMKILDESGTDAVLLRRYGPIATLLWQTIEQRPEWIPVLYGYFDSLYLRRGSRPMKQLEDLLRRGEEWRPNTPNAIAARGFLWEALDQPDLEQALQCWRTAVKQDVVAGLMVFRPMTEVLIRLQRGEEAREYIQGLYQNLNRPQPGLPETHRRELLKKLAECWTLLQPAAAPQNRSDDH